MLEEEEKSECILSSHVMDGDEDSRQPSRVCNDHICILLMEGYVVDRKYRSIAGDPQNAIAV